MKSHELLKQMTLEEKASLCSGKNFWELKSVEHLGLNTIMVTDGPHGLRKQAGDSDHLGLNNSVKATCFPTAVTTASSWDPELMHEMGQALGEECLQEKVSVILGPGANIKRSPLCGRNFEYISEDPLLTGEMAAGLINGVQSKGVGTSLKHYAMNNQETRRMSVNSVVDERAQREIYLKGFEIAVKKAQPWTVMCSYNKINGTYASDNKKVLTDILKEEWGHTGLVVTDWGACNDRVEGIKAGMELEMPGSRGINDAKIVQAVQEGKLTEELLDKAVIRIIDLILKSQVSLKDNYKYDRKAHHDLARKIGGESSVLLKNDGILPLDPKKKEPLIVLGAFAKTPRYQGAGSSIINPHEIVSFCDELDRQGIAYEYAPGYETKSGEVNRLLIEEAADLAQKGGTVLIFAGLTDNYESEGFDRTHLNMPDNHNELIRRVSELNSETVVILQNGSPVTMPWLDKVKAILECYLGGEAAGEIASDILFGKVNPSGKLAETFPLKIEDTPSFKHFPGSPKSVEYRESIYVGYRYYDKAEKPVLFPFGHGLSYTSFAYSDLHVTPGGSSGEAVKVSLKVKNTGNRAGKEIVQLYIKNPSSLIFKAEKELRAFSKVTLEAGETKEVIFELNVEAFSFWNVNTGKWHTEAGEYTILAGASAADIRLEGTVAVNGDSKDPVPDLRIKLSEYYQLKNNVLDISEEQFTILYGRPLPPRERDPKAPFDRNSLICEIKDTFAGKRIYKMINKQMAGMTDSGDETGAAMMQAMINELPLRAMIMLGGEKMGKHALDALLLMVNGKLLRGLFMMLKK
jgi:beta-glucosidase